MAEVSKGNMLYKNLSSVELFFTCGGEQAAAQRELHAPDGATVVAGQILPKLDILKVPGSGLVRLDALEAGGGGRGSVLAGNLDAVRGGNVGGQAAQLLLLLLLAGALLPLHLGADDFGRFGRSLSRGNIQDIIKDFRNLSERIISNSPKTSYN